MTNRGSIELRECRNELRNIINDLKYIESRVRHEYKNIGNDQCADSIQSVISKYEWALRTLNSVDANVLDRLKEAAEEAKRIAGAVK